MLIVYSVYGWRELHGRIFVDHQSKSLINHDISHYKHEGEKHIDVEFDCYSDSDNSISESY